MSTTSSTLSLIALSENDKLRGYENYIAWKTLMEAHGRPKGLHKYWENKITVPSSGSTEPSTSDPIDPKIVTTSPTPTTTPTPVHSTKPSELEYELRENVALS